MLYLESDFPSMTLYACIYSMQVYLARETEKESTYYFYIFLISFSLFFNVWIVWLKSNLSLKQRHPHCLPLGHPKHLPMCCTLRVGTFSVPAVGRLPIKGGLWWDGGVQEGGGLTHRQGWSSGCGCVWWRGGVGVKINKSDSLYLSAWSYQWLPL